MKRSLIIKMSVLAWGTGTPLREFLHVDDMASACIHLTNIDFSVYSKNNITNAIPQVLLEVVNIVQLKINETISDITEYQGTIKQTNQTRRTSES